MQAEYGILLCEWSLTTTSGDNQTSPGKAALKLLLSRNCTALLASLALSSKKMKGRHIRLHVLLRLRCSDGPAVYPRISHAEDQDKP